MAPLNAAAIAAITAAVALLTKVLKDNQQPPAAAVPAGTATSRALKAIHAVERRTVQRKALEAVARAETADFKVIHHNSLFNIHVGSGAGDWNGRVYDTFTRLVYLSAEARRQHLKALGRSIYASEDLRVYDSLEQSVRDVLLLFKRATSIYGRARVLYEAGRVKEFFEAMVEGDGKEGYVGNPSAKKASDYIARLNQAYKVTA